MDRPATVEEVTSGVGSPVEPRPTVTRAAIVEIAGFDAEDPELDRPLPNAERLVAEAVTLAAAESDDTELPRLVAQYWRLVSDEELAGRTAADMVAATASHRELAAQRLVGELKLRVTAADADTDHTAIEIVTDDMPFLVDSVTAALTARDARRPPARPPAGRGAARGRWARCARSASTSSPRTPSTATSSRAGCGSRSTASATRAASRSCATT